MTAEHFPLKMKQMKGCDIMKALASDFDGTLYLHDAVESYREEDIAGIKQLQKQGCLFGLCTGRPLWGITAFLSERLHPEFECSLSLETAKQLSMLEEDVESIAIQAGGNIYAYKKARAFTDIPVIQQIEEIKDQNIHGLSFRMVDEEAAARLCRSMEEQLSNTCAAFQNQNFVDVVPYGCSKGKALLKLKKLMNLHSCFGIGDSYNDIPMLQDADVSFTFKSSPQKVREAADHLVDSVGEAIRSYMLR